MDEIDFLWRGRVAILFMLQQFVCGVRVLAGSFPMGFALELNGSPVGAQRGRARRYPIILIVLKDKSLGNILRIFREYVCYLLVFIGP